MGLLELNSKVLVTYKADTSDIRAKLKQLSGDERALHEQRLLQAEAENRNIEGQIQGLHRWAGFVAAGAVAVAAAKVGMDAYAKTSKEAAAEVEKIKTATSTAFDGMEIAIGRVVVALGPLITGLAKVAAFSAGGLEDLAMLVTGDIDGLRKKAGLSKDGQTGQWYLSNARDTYVRNSGATNIVEETLAGQAFDRQQVINAQRDAALRADNSRFAQSMLDTVASLKDGFTMVNGYIRGRIADPWSGKAEAKKAFNVNDLNSLQRQAYLRSMLGRKSSDTQAGGFAGGWLNYGLGSLNVGYSDGYGAGYGGQGFGSHGSYGLGSVAEEGIGPFGIKQDDQVRETLTRIEREQKAAKDAAQVKRFGDKDSWLASTFGTIEEFDAYARSFEMLSSAVTTAMGAWIDGTGGAGEAIKKFIAGSLKALAVEASTNALKSLAQAATYASTPGMQFWVPGALKSAAAWGAVAVAAGVGAHELGGGGGGGGASAGGGHRPSAPSSGGAGGGSQGTAVTIVYGDSFADDSPRARQLKARKMVNTALGTSAVEYR